ncbi:pentapeptide repeat-containing protein [Aquimarina mytili]|uniref:Pentapeptide repeat-containing protein n=1 Tax=Aquimarina mytili TaxID=874423 RepID=A0A937A1P6_9FLAO|nr:pentapeptide repeat-containing protein [Aquimarina mytili]MBL0685860.1 pentapeptide repeat-containing protein [Aquimarina mytili]
MEDLSRILAESEDPISQKQINEMLEEHRLFLENGGNNGKFERLGLGGMTMAIYNKKSTKGQQLSLSKKKLAPGIDLSKANLSYADLSGCIAEDVNFEGANLEGSILTDSFFKGSSFENASLEKSDLSDSDLRDTNFISSKFGSTDFERAKLDGAKFDDTPTGAINLVL